MAEIIVAVVILAVAAIIILWRENGRQSLKRELTEAQTLLRSETERRAQSEIAAEELRKEYDSVRDARAQLTEARQQITQLQEDNSTLRTDNTKHAAQRATLQNELTNAQANAEEKLAFVKQARDNMETEFKNLAQMVLDEKSKKFDENSQKALEPLRDNLAQFRRRVDEIYGAEAKERASLKTEIENLHNNAAQIGRDAENLTRALKGDKKMQGDWGELTLARLLEESGLREGESYHTQQQTRTDEGNLQRPDVIIHLPENRHLIIDSKVSLVNYVDAVSSDDHAAYRAAIDRHVQAVRKHLSDLSARHYQRLPAINTPDFVFMFMPQEPAFYAALNADHSLFADAFKKKIILCSPTTLLAVLRTVERIWKLEKQNNNAEEIARQGASLYDKLCGFVEDMGKIEKSLQGARDAFDAAKGKLSDGRGNVLRQAEKLRDMGVNPKKRLPENMTQRSD